MCTSKCVCKELEVEVKNGKDFKSINELETGQQQSPGSLQMSSWFRIIASISWADILRAAQQTQMNLRIRNESQKVRYLPSLGEMSIFSITSQSDALIFVQLF